MPGIKVDPPPLDQKIVDANGYPTQYMRDFMHRIWERTGGFDDDITALMRYSNRTQPGMDEPALVRYSDQTRPGMDEGEPNYRPQVLRSDVQAQDDDYLATIAESQQVLGRQSDQSLMAASTASNLLQSLISQGLQAEILERLEKLEKRIQKGMIIMFNGALSDVPAGWQFCDGTNGTPDLRDKFIRAGNTPGDTGGSNTATVDPTITATASTSVSLNVNTTEVAGPENKQSDKYVVDAVSVGSVNTTVNASASQETINTVPEYYELAFIMKV